MQVNWGRVARALFATVILTMSLFTTVPASAGTAPPAPAAEVTPAAPEPGPYKIKNLNFGPPEEPYLCLDTDGTHVHAWFCDIYDRGQRWIIWDGGFTKSWATGKCLRGKDHLVGGVWYPVQLVACNANDRNQYWRHWSGGWYKNLRSNACLTAYREGNNELAYVATAPCELVRPQYWEVALWF